MGNAPSADELVRAETLQEQLAELERAVSAQQRRAQSQTHCLLPHQLELHGVVLTTQADVRVLVGPVVGRVECASARVLLEVDADALVTCHVSARNALTLESHELVQCRTSAQCAAGKPTVFHIPHLVPGRDYSFAFSGVRKQDAIARTGGFRTPSLESSTSIRAIAASGNNLYDMERCEANLWRDVRRLVAAKDALLVVHLGGQVAMQRMFDQSCALLLRHAAASMSAPDWRALEARARDVLRSAYRTQWTAMPDLQFVLAHASNLMLWSDADVYEAFTTRQEFAIDHEQPTMQMQVLRTVTRCARQLYHEYQRQLWDDHIDELYAREKELWDVAERALATTAQIYQLAQQIPLVESDLETQKRRHEIEGARRVEKHLRALEAEKRKAETQLVSFREVLAPQRGEEFVYCVGEIGFLFVDQRSARLEPGGSQAAENDMLSAQQWDFVESALASDRVQLWVVCSELPVADEPVVQDTDVETSSRSRSPRLDGPDAPSRWCRNPDAQARLLALLFDWKMAQASREFVFVAGASRLCYGSVTTVRDATMRTHALQYVTSAITASPALVSDSERRLAPLRTRWRMTDRFEGEHTERIHDKAFLRLALGAGADTRVSIEHVQAQRHDHELARVLLGPVVGFVDDTTAVVLLEVDRDMDVIATFTNALTRETRRLHQRFCAKTPSAFYCTHLRPAHYYDVSFANVQRAAAYRASFTTRASAPRRLSLLVLCHDDVLATQALARGTGTETTRLYGAIANNVVDVPFAPVDLTIHLGGQLSIRDNAFIHDALALADAALSAESDGSSDALAARREAAVALVVEKLREMVRLAWSLPGVVDTLAHGAHVFVSSDCDVLAPVNPRASDLLVRETLARVLDEYQRLLLPPSMQTNVCRLASATAACRAEQQPLSHAFGAIGLFVLPLRLGTGSAAVDDGVWTDLTAFLASPALAVLLLVTHAPVVEHAFEDVVALARFDAAATRTFGFHAREQLRLLEVVFAWKRSHPRREVVLVSGTSRCSFDSVIRELAPLPSPRADAALLKPQRDARSANVVLQYVVGRMSRYRLGSERAPSVLERLVCAEQGTLGTAYAFQHFVAKKQSQPSARVLAGGESSNRECHGASAADAAAVAPTSDAVALNDSGDDDSAVTSQLAHLVIAIEDEHVEIESKLRSHEPLERAGQSSVSPAVTSSWTLVSSDALEAAPTDSPLDRDVDERYRRHGRVAAEEVSATRQTWSLSPELPVWLDALLSEALDSDESARVEAIRAMLLERAEMVRTSFEHVAALRTGLATLRDARTYVPLITEACDAFFALSGAAFRETACAPSPLVIAHTVEQLRQSDRSEERACVLGSVDPELYALLLERCVVNATVAQRRLESRWA